jgi:curved DNA-binding protein CbpA
MARLPADEAPVEVAAGLDPSALALSNEEGFVLSRAFGRRQTVRELVGATGLGEAKARELVGSLIEKGALVVVGQSGPQRKASPADADYAGIVFDIVAMGEATDLTQDQKKRILYVEMHLERWNHYALLGLKRTAAAGDIKKQYFKASKEFHPDAHFRKNLGTYKKRVDTIFRAMKAAYDVLNNKKKREAYDATLDPSDLTPEELKELEKRARERRLEEAEKRKVEKAETDKEDRKKRNAERLKNRRLGRNPMVQRLKRAQDLLGMAEAASAAGKLVEAGRHARMALEFAPSDPGVTARAKPFIEAGGVDKGRAIIKQAEHAQVMGDPSEASDLADTAVETAPRDPQTLVGAGRLFQEIGKPRRALKVAQKATELATNDPSAWLLLLELCESAGNWHTAQRAAERLVELKPKDKGFKDRLKRAKREAKS